MTASDRSPHPHARAAILSCGDELALGETLDTNSQYLARQLADLGIETVEHVTVGDDLHATAEAFTRLSTRADLVIATGGLGPTADDLTRQALARAMNDELVEDPFALEEIRAWFTGRGRVFSEMNRVQALRPSRGRCLPNPHGTAPGLAARLGNADMYCLPGPPREMKPMFESRVVPELAPPAGARVRTRIIGTVGLGESQVAQSLGELMQRDRLERGLVQVGTTASGGIVACRARVRGGEDQLDEAAAIIRTRLGAAVFAEAHHDLPRAIVARLSSRGETVATAESCTGGVLAGAITAIPGSSACFHAGWTCYSNAIKSAQLGVPEALFASVGAVSREVAGAMARGALERAGGHWALSVTGIAGPEGGTEHKPVGTVYIGLASRAGSLDVRRFAMIGSRGDVRAWSVTAALAMLHLHTAGAPEMRLLRQTEG